jgi:Holliday junction DNA helicase RuvA
VIGSLRGTLLERSGAGVTVEVAGVGYRLATTPATSASLGPDGAEVFVWVHHHIREDAQTLYGFRSRDERDVFETLIGTHGVGPALGLAIVAVHDPDGLRLAVATDDVGALCLVPGVGKKTAARLLIELKSRLDVGPIDLSDLPSGASADPSGRSVPSAHADVREALAALGYGTDEIAVAVRHIPSEGEPADLLRHALQHLAVH